MDALHLWPRMATFVWLFVLSLVLQLILPVLLHRYRFLGRRSHHYALVNGNVGKRKATAKALRRSAVFVLFVATVLCLTNAVLLKLRTGAWAQQAYDWYSLKNAGIRLHGQTTDIPRDILSTCNYNYSVLPTTMTTLDDVPTSDSTIVVYVVPFAQGQVVSFGESELVPTVEPTHSIRQDAADLEYYERVQVGVDSLTMFPYLWHKLLGPHFDPRMERPSTTSRSIPSRKIRFELIQSTEELSALPLNSNILAVVQWMPTVLHLLKDLPEDAKVGFLALSREDCNNDRVKEYARTQLVFGMFPYGDCSLVDGDRFAVVPLGPSYEHGFPINVHQTHLPKMRQRKYVLNMMTSSTIDKPTRVQAKIAALDVCTRLHLSCTIEQGNLLFKAFQLVDRKLGTNFRWILSSAPNAYVDVVKNSLFTICPHGKNPEQYRIWEALAAGSIPIIEDFPEDCVPGTFLHPSYPTTWKCRKDLDVHAILKQLQAPVLFVSDWQTDLLPLIQTYMDDFGTIQDMQDQVIDWYERIGRHVQAQLVYKIHKYFS